VHKSELPTVPVLLDTPKMGLLNKHEVKINLTHKRVTSRAHRPSDMVSGSVNIAYYRCQPSTSFIG
jgi:hypothetical protein